MPSLDPQLESRIRQMVPTLPGWCSSEKALHMAESICRNLPVVCVEIGVFGGRSLLPMALACRHLGRGHVFGVDPWCETDSLEGMTHPDEIAFWSQIKHDQIFLDCQRAINQANLAATCSLIRSTAAQSADLFDRIDLLHIDGNHHEQSAIRDVRLYLPKVADGGDIWVDDADWDSTQLAIRLLHEECDLVHNYGTYLHLRKRGARGPLDLAEGAQESKSLNLARRQLIELPEGVVGDFRGGVYNPGAALIGDHFVLLARNERYTELDRRTDPARSVASSRPLSIMLDRRGQVVSASPLSVSGEMHADRAEDFRLFRWKSRLYTSFSRVTKSGRIEIQTAEVDLDNLEIGSPIQTQLDFEVAMIEKNWCFFPHGEDLFVVYSFQPFRLLRVVNSQAFHCRTIVSAPVTFHGQTHPLRFAGQISNSTSPIPFRDHLLLFIHHRDVANNYQHYAVCLDRRTLHPQRISRHPLFSGGDAQGMRPNVVYLTSVVVVDQEYWFFFGEGDEHLSYVRYTESDLAHLLSDSVEICLDLTERNQITGPYLYRQHGLFERTVFLREDGTIENGSEHDSHWKLMTLDDRTELWIIGTGEISCRLQSVSPGDWEGIWNRGSRPRTTLTRHHK